MPVPHAASSLCEIFVNANGREDLSVLKRHAGIEDTADIVHAALGMTALALNLQKKGYAAHILHDGGLSKPIEHYFRLRAAFRMQFALEPCTEFIPLPHAPEFDRALENVKTFMRTEDSSMAVGFALTFARACVDRMKECNASSARVFLTRGSTPDSPGILMTQQPFDVRRGKAYDSAKADTRKVRGRVHKRAA